MDTCLKKRIKGETYGDLPIYNTIKFIFDGVSPEAKYTLYLSLGSDYQIVALGGTKIYDSTGNTELTSPVSAQWNQTYRFTYQKGDGLLFTNKYGLVRFGSPYQGLNIHLNILELASCLDFTNFKPCVNSGWTNLNITGEIVEFAQKQVLYGRNSGSIVFGLYTGITLNGVLLQNEVTIKYGSSMVDPTTEETAQGYQITT